MYIYSFIDTYIHIYIYIYIYILPNDIRSLDNCSLTAQILLNGWLKVFTKCYFEQAVPLRGWAYRGGVIS
jgi:hypothetical protein